MESIFRHSKSLFERGLWLSNLQRRLHPKQGQWQAVSLYEAAKTEKSDTKESLKIPVMGRELACSSRNAWEVA